MNYNVRHFLELCLKSVEAAVSDIASEIIVVDNNSTDDSCEMVKSLFPNIKLIQNKENVGFSKGNNIGVKHAKGEFICILNPDTVVAEDSFKVLLDFAEKQNNCGAVGCRLIDGNGRFLPESKRHIPTPWVSVKKILGFTNSYYASEIAEDNIGKTEILVGAFMLIKKDLYTSVGGFDEDYFMYGEDIDLSYKILKAGRTNYYNGNTSIIHFKGESTKKDQIYVRRFYKAMQIFYQKHYNTNVLFNMLIWIWVKMAGVLVKPVKTPNLPTNKNVLISTVKNVNFEKALGTNLFYTFNPDNFEDNTQYILDNNVLTFKQIIDIMKKKKSSSKLIFRILPKNSNFIIGSDNSKNRGTVILF